MPSIAYKNQPVHAAWPGRPPPLLPAAPVVAMAECVRHNGHGPRPEPTAPRPRRTPFEETVLAQEPWQTDERAERERTKSDREDEGHDETDEATAPRRPRRKAKRFRLTNQQTRFLMSEFAKQPNPDSQQRDRLALEIPGLTVRQVQVWFQNRRAKIKRLAMHERESVVGMHAVPEGFDTVQALHSPYGAVNGPGVALSPSVRPVFGDAEGPPVYGPGPEPTPQPCRSTEQNGCSPRPCWRGHKRDVSGYDSLYTGPAYPLLVYNPGFEPAPPSNAARSSTTTPCSSFPLGISELGVGSLHGLHGVGSLFTLPALPTLPNPQSLPPTTEPYYYGQRPGYLPSSSGRATYAPAAFPAMAAAPGHGVSRPYDEYQGLGSGP